MATRLEKTESELVVVKNVNNQLVEHVKGLEWRAVLLEKATINNSQYLRRRQMEIRNLPSGISNGDSLKKQMADLLSLTGVVVKPDDIDKCHTLGDKSVIMEFKERELRDGVLRGRKLLKNKQDDLRNMAMEKVMILESLCKPYAEMDYICHSLKRNSEVVNTWFFNGRLYIEVTAGVKTQISHKQDLYDIFGKQMIDAFVRVSR